MLPHKEPNPNASDWTGGRQGGKEGRTGSTKGALQKSEAVDVCVWLPPHVTKGRRERALVSGISKSSKRPNSKRSL